MLFAKNVEEIKSDRALALYGAALALAYFATSVFLFAHDHYLSLVSKQVEAVCWPFFESCHQYRNWSNLEIRLTVLIFSSASLFTCFAFLKGKIRFGYLSLTALALSHIALIVQDFRNTQNQYYMLMWVVFVYLFWPKKKAALHYLILSFYLWAARLKLNGQWLSGKNLYSKLWFVPERLNSAACIYVVILETLMIWGLVSKNRIWFWATLAQLALFHVISVSQIGYYYPVLMFAILSIYPLSRVSPELSSGPPRLTRSGWLIVIIFAFFQVYPSLVSRNRAISGVGRTFALNMFEGIFDCDIRWVEHDKNGPPREMNAKDKSTERIECEPIYYYSKTTSECRKRASDPNFADLDFYMDIGRKTEGSLSPVIHERAFCSKHLHFNLFLPNAWIDQ